MIQQKISRTVKELDLAGLDPIGHGRHIIALENQEAALNGNH